MKHLILTAVLISMTMPLLATVAHADLTPPGTQDKKRPNPTPKPGPRDEGDGD